MKKDNKKLILIVVGAIFVVLLLCCIGFFVFIASAGKATEQAIKDAVVSSSPTSNALANFKKYESTRYGFEISHPDNWEVQEELNSNQKTDKEIQDALKSGVVVPVQFISPNENSSDTFNENVNIALNTYEDKGKLEEDAKAATASFSKTKGVTNYKQLEFTKATIDGVTAYNVVYTATINGKSLQQSQYYFAKNGKAYVVTLTSAPSAYSEVKPTVDTMINSLRIK